MKGDFMKKIDPPMGANITKNDQKGKTGQQLSQAEKDILEYVHPFLYFKNNFYQFSSIADDDRFVQIFTAVDSEGETLLSVMIQTDFLRTIDSFLPRFKKFTQLINIVNSYGESPIHICALYNKVDAYSKFIALGLDIDYTIKDCRGLTSLDIALSLKHTTLSDSLRTKCIQTNSNIYHWGQTFSPISGLTTIQQPEALCFNDELSAPTQIKYGSNFGMCLTDTGSVYSWGLCSYGKLGHVKKIDHVLPTGITEFKNKFIKEIACGKDHSMALDDLSTLYVWGNGSGGRLGLGTSDVVQVPTVLKFFTEILVKSIACGQEHSMVLTQDGQVYSWGNGLMGKLGYQVIPGGFTSQLSQPTPRKVPHAAKIAQIACSNWHSVLLSVKGEVYSFGSNDKGRLGRQLYSKTSNCFEVRIVPIEQKIKKILCGLNFTVALSEQNTIWSWGSNAKSQIGLPYLGGVTEFFDRPTISKHLVSYSIQNVEVGNEHVVVLTNEGEVLTYGSNEFNQCGNGTVIEHGDFRITRVKIPDASVVFKISAGGNNSMISLSMDHQTFGLEMSKLLNNNTNVPFSDLRFIANGLYDRFTECNRAVVAARCPTLDTLIRKEIDSPNQGNKVALSLTRTVTSETINNVIYLSFPVEEFETLNVLIRYIYTDHANLIKAAKELGPLSLDLKLLRLRALWCFHNKENLLEMKSVPGSTLLEDFDNLKNEDFLHYYSDISFRCFNEDQPPEIVKSYKVFLGLQSTYFKTMLIGNFVEKDKRVIDLLETSPNAVSLLFHYLYSQAIPTSLNDCLELLVISDLHQLPRCKDLCASIIRTHIRPDNLCYIYNIALYVNVKSLIMLCESKLNSTPNVDKMIEFDTLPEAIQEKLKINCTTTSK
ncbi:hypothetical protein CYY_003252 [Polysphondylium violaceum]|uniref:BTB domain-containing protein n=1 Tax=Polysphondylium violaceum TaxID=133409 RepID=A0A8J4PV06_9MYCE|nr:hypothetical protein CYY_003252 [Polysphondylium violaceum]